MKLDIARDVKHTTVFADPTIYAGWPANHGAWRWGDELLVGFLQGPFGRSAMHNIHDPMVKRLARSLDGGKTWKVEVPNVDFEAKEVSPAPYFDLVKSIIRVCGRYDHGGEECVETGGFYLSHDRGKTWEGAYEMWPTLKGTSLHNTSRTCVIGDLLFSSAAEKLAWGSDDVAVHQHDGRRFVCIGQLPQDPYRCVMPSVARIGSYLVVAARRRSSYPGRCWIDAYASSDGGWTWAFLSEVAETCSTGRTNGNPPAIAEVRGSLYCAYAHRESCTMRLKASHDGGKSWAYEKVFREGSCSDIGYPVLFPFEDRLVCVYYWSDAGEAQHIEATEIPLL